MSASRNRRYTEQDRNVALVFWESVRHREDGLTQAAKMADVHVDALRYWIGGGGVTVPEQGDPFPAPEPPDDWDAPAGMPEPPEYLQSCIRWPEDVIAAPELAAWVKRHFIDADGELVNLHHKHLRHCLIAWEWTNVANAKQQIPVAAMTRMVAKSGDRWDKAREASQMRRVWGDVPTFLVTVDAVWWGTSDPATRCAVIDHELGHGGMKLDPATREPKFDKRGRPQYALLGHDFSGFLYVTERWGVDAAEPNVKKLVEVAARTPLIARATLERVCCGT